ncbi:PI-PLC domain-containing protein [Paraburkholderia oxyphila]|uniref:hypothetical protein n=1 Tax=Paraburkholderia oxyphila TaxID=614212 RepID=UPI0012ED06E5
MAAGPFSPRRTGAAPLVLPSPASFDAVWTAPAVQCFRTNPGVHIVAIAVNTEADYKAAACAGVDAVLADSPKQMVPLREALRRGYTCP